MSALDPLDIPDFLRRPPSQKPPAHLSEPAITMPPVALVAVLRAVERGADTWPKIVQSVTRRNAFTEAQMREALRRHIDNGDIDMTGRRYTRADRGA